MAGMGIKRRDLLLAFAAAPLPALAKGGVSSAERIGLLVANEWLARPDFMPYRSRDGAVLGLHYAEVATAYGALRLSAALRDAALFARIRERHGRWVAAGKVNTANHVDVNVYGVWPLELSRKTGMSDDRARGLEMADGQWQETTPDGLTAQARYWIDDMWMIGALQIEAWRATGDRKYLDRAALMARLYVARLQQPNGLFHHGTDAPFFWARGNGWVAAGLAEILSELPARHADRPAILAGYRRMMAALLANQSEDGMWRQLIDRPDAWKETSGTAMFGFAMALGARKGLLPGRAYARAARRAWDALVAYVQPDGRLTEICIGTGKSKDAAYYLGRPRAIGDLHGQAALLWLASELAG